MSPARCCIVSSMAWPLANALFQYSFQASQRNLAQRAAFRDIAIELQQGFCRALPREFAGRIVRHHAPQHAIGIDRDTGRWATADRVALSMAQLLRERTSRARRPPVRRTNE